jgi:trehalose-phosphatase
MPLPPVRLHLDDVARRLARVRALDLATDFDGTLSPIVERPAQARMDPRARRALERLARAPHVRVAVLSGRRLADLRRRVRIGGVHLVGSGGLETARVFGRAAAALPPLPAAIEEAMSEWATLHPPAWIEPKGPALGVHFGLLTPSIRAPFIAGVRRRLAPFTRRIEVTRNARSWDLAPRGSANKGTRLREWHEAQHAGALLVYLGDDANDLPALAYARSRRGLSISVGQPLRGARYTIRSPHHAAAFLEWLAQTWGALHPGHAVRGARSRPAHPAARRNATS